MDKLTRLIRDSVKTIVIEYASYPSIVNIRFGNPPDEDALLQIEKFKDFLYSRELTFYKFSFNKSVYEPKEIADGFKEAFENLGFTVKVKNAPYESGEGVSTKV